MIHAMAFASGLLFGLGLILAGMANPAKVQGFLDLFGTWDPSLAFVMGGAIAVGLAVFAIAGRMRRTFLDLAFSLPTNQGIDARLLGGSVAFGAGWGLAGFCPGPALVALGAGEPKAIAFVAAMLAGMGLYEMLSLRDRAALERHAMLAGLPGSGGDG
jgi:uncharacterized membrane protein YedE/YeeE